MSMRMRDWLRRHALWLLGTLVFGALALYLPYHDVRKVEQRHHPVHARASLPGQWVEYDGARWRLLDLHRDLAPLKHPRADAQVLVATFEVMLAGGTRKELGKCRVRLSDRHDRRWNDSSDFVIFAHHVRVPGLCSGLEMGPDFKPLPPRRSWRFMRFFVVPRTLDPATLRAEIVIPYPGFDAGGNFARLLPPAPRVD